MDLDYHLHYRVFFFCFLSFFSSFFFFSLSSPLFPLFAGDDYWGLKCGTRTRDTSSELAPESASSLRHFLSFVILVGHTTFLLVDPLIGWKAEC